MARVNLTPNSESAPERTPVGDQQIHDAKIRYDREDRRKLAALRLQRLTEGSTGISYRGKRASTEDAVDRVLTMLATGRVTLEQMRSENDADEQLLQGWKVAPPRPGSAAAQRREAVLARFRARTAALEQAASLPGVDVTTQESQLREAHAATTAARKGRRRKGMGTTPPPRPEREPPPEDDEDEREYEEEPEAEYYAEPEAEERRYEEPEARDYEEPEADYEDEEYEAPPDEEADDEDEELRRRRRRRPPMRETGATCYDPKGGRFAVTKKKKRKV